MSSPLRIRRRACLLSASLVVLVSAPVLALRYIGVSPVYLTYPSLAHCDRVLCDHGSTLGLCAVATSEVEAYVMSVVLVLLICMLLVYLFMYSTYVLYCPCVGLSYFSCILFSAVLYLC